MLKIIDKLLNKGLQRKAKARVVRNRPRSQHPPWATLRAIHQRGQFSTGGVTRSDPSRRVPSLCH